MLWKRSSASEPALITHNFFQTPIRQKCDAKRNLGRTRRLAKQSATAWVSVIGDGGSCGVGMAATIGTLFGALDAAHYRPKERPDSVRIVHSKTGAPALTDLRCQKASRALRTNAENLSEWSARVL